MISEGWLLIAAGCTTFCDAPGQWSTCGESEVCGLDVRCHAPSDVYRAHLTWTIDGQPASVASCAGHDQVRMFFVELRGAHWMSVDAGTAPCADGAAEVPEPPRFADVPRSYDRASVEFDGSFLGSGDLVKVDLAGNATFDLHP
jgi:hypothetical protein